MLFELSAALGASRTKYAIVVDAGSSGTRFSIYQWESTDSAHAVAILPGSSASYPIPLSSAVNNKSVVPAIFESLIKTSCGQLSSSDWSSTHLILFGTAGMRLLPESDQDRILSDVFYYLRENSPFRIKRDNIRVIPGSLEGVYGWISVNFLLGRFSNSFAGPIFSEIGGASTQLAFEVTEDVCDSEVQSICVAGKRFRVWSHSWLGYGVDQGLLAITNNLTGNYHPCMTKDYNYSSNGKTFVGTGDAAQCEALIQSVLFDDPSFEGTAIPSMDRLSNFVGVSVYQYGISGIGEPENISMDDLWNATLEFASLDWAEAQEKYNNSAHLDAFLMDLVYSHAMITRGFNLNDTWAYDFPAAINGTAVAYPLGGLISLVWDIQIQDEGKIPIKVTLIVNLVLLAVFVLLLALYKRTCGARRGAREIVPNALYVGSAAEV